MGEEDWSLLQRNLGQRNDRNEDDNTDRNCMRITAGQDYVGRDLVTDLIAKHQQTDHRHA